MQFRDWLSELFASLSDAIFNNEAGGEKVLSKKDILFGQWDSFYYFYLFSAFFDNAQEVRVKEILEIISG